MENMHGISAGGQKLIALPRQKSGLEFNHGSRGLHALLQVHAVVAQMRMMGQVRNDPFGCLGRVRGLRDREARKAARTQDAIKF